GINVLENRAWATIFFRDQGELNEAQRKQLTQWKLEFDSKLRGVYVEGVEQGLFTSMPPYVVVGGIIGACNFLPVWFRDSGKLSIDEIGEINADFLLNGLLLR